MTRRGWLLVVALVALLSRPWHGLDAAAGDLDPGFGNGGKVFTDFSGGRDEAAAIVLQTDGRMVVAGRRSAATDPEGLFSDFAIARYNADGSLDTAFGTNGRVITDFGGSDRARGVAIQSDGKIVVAGVTGGALALARFNADGSPDVSFGPNANGTVAASAFDAVAVRVLPDNRILVAGTSNFDFALARYNSDGSPDLFFGPNLNGRVLSGFTGTHFAAALALDAGGNAVVAGSTRHASGVFHVALVKFQPNGRVDASFGSAGFVTTPIRSQSFAGGLAIQPDGRIVVAGSSADLSTGLSAFALARYDTNGALDATFGAGGIAISARSGGANAVALQADGRMLAAGVSRFVLIGLNANGSADTRFGSGGDGVIATDMGGGAAANALVVQPDNKVIVVGSGNGRIDFALARYDLTRVNVPPVTDVSGNNTVAAGERFLRAGSITDADSTSWTATVDYGDGTGVRNLTLSDDAFVLSHIYTSPGTYSITVCVTDDAGLSACVAISILVTAPPVSGEPPCVRDLPGQFRSLKHHPEALGFHLGAGTPDPTLFRHYQGLQRLPGPGTPYFFVTRSGNSPTFDPELGDDPGNLLVVRFDSRNATGERLRSNRLRHDTDTEDTAPPSHDAVIRNIDFDGSGGWPDFGHPGGIQIFGTRLAIPLEAPYGSGPPTRLVLVDIENPESPHVVFQQALQTPAGFLEKFGVLTLTRRLDNDKVLLVVTGPGNETLELFESNVDDLGAEHLRFDHVRTWHGSDLAGGEWPTGAGGHQTLFLVRGCGDALYMLGTRNTAGGSTFPFNEDRAELYRVSIDSTNDVDITLVESKHMFCESHEVGLTCDFAAASAFHVTAAGELLLYATEHSDDGPDGTVRMAEFRSDRLFRATSPNWAPAARAGGPYRAFEGDSLVVDGSASVPPVAQPWVELYEDEDFQNRSVVMDWADRNQDDYDDLGRLDDFSDQADSLIFAAPQGCDLHLYEDAHYRDRELVFPGNGSVQRIPRLDDEEFGDEIDSLQFVGSTCEARAMQHTWDFDDDATFETPGVTATIDSAASARIVLRVCGAFFRCDEELTTVEVLDPTPSITSFSVPSNTTEGATIVVSGAFINPANRALTVTVDWGDEQIVTTMPPQIFGEHSYAEDGSYTVRVEVCDPDRRCDLRSAVVVVANAPPVARIIRLRDETGRALGPSDVALAGLRVDLTGSVTDAGARDTHVASIQWDDATLVPVSVAAGRVTASFTYAAAGDHVVRLRVEDDDGGVGEAARTLRVVEPAGALASVLSDLTVLAQRAGLPTRARRELLNAIDSIQGNNAARARNGAIDKLASGDLVAALTKIGHIIGSLLATETASPALDLTGQKAVIVLTAKAVAVAAATRAAAAGDPLAIEKATALIVQGNARLTAGDHLGAVDSYRRAVQQIQHLL